MTERPLTVTGLGHRFGDTAVLHDVSFEVSRGQVVALLGPSGVGKTTLLRAISGLLTPQRGAIHLAGRCVVADGVEQVPTEQRGVGLVFQDYALFPHLSVRDNVAFGMPRPVDDARIAELLALTDLSPLASRRPHALSGGQQQRVALARALAASPKLLLLDEPFANVDPALRLELGEGLRHIVAEARQAALLITHDRDEALGLADRVVVLAPSNHGGRVAQDALPHVVYSQPASAVVAGLTGPCRLVSGTRSGNTLHTPLGPWPLHPDCPPDATHAVVRPESLRLVDGAHAIGRRRHAPPGWLVRVDTPAGALWVESGSSPPESTAGIVPRAPLWAVSPPEPSR